LEYDMATQARTFEDLAYELQRMIAGHIATSRRLHKRPFEGLSKAPRRFWDMFERSRIAVPTRSLAFKPALRVKPELRIAV